VIQEVLRFDDLCAIREEWSELWDRAMGATVFQSPEWLLPWWRHLFKGGEMWTIGVRRNGCLVGLAPMFLYGNRTAAFAGSGVSDYLGFLVSDAEAAHEIWTGIAASRRWDVCEFQDIWFQNPAIRDGADGLKFESRPRTVCPVTILSRDFESRLSSKFRHNLRNARNRLSTVGASFETAAAEQDSEFLDALVQLHAARWEARGEAGVLSTGAQRLFLRDACCAFRQRGWLRLHGLRLRGELKAVVCIFCALGRSAYYLGGFDPHLARYSPGSALISFAINQAAAERCTEFDFLRQGELYKYHWGATDRVNLRLTVRHSETSAEDR
jgi:CelD/BcsL family acetyltransferase involved in cellulose biosynthesis